jgi:hypothetical protein
MRVLVLLVLLSLTGCAAYQNTLEGVVRQREARGICATPPCPYGSWRGYSSYGLRRYRY